MPPSEYLMDLKVKNSAEFADVFEESYSINSIVIEDNKIDKIFSGSDAGKAVRIIKGEEIDYEFSADAKAKAEVSSQNIKEKINILKKANVTARSLGPKIKQVTVSYADKKQAVKIENSKGLSVRDARTRARFLINVVAKENGILQTGYETAGGEGDGIINDFFNNVIVETLGQMAAERALLMLTARHAPSGKMPVVIMSEAGGTLIHEACGHGLEADFIVKNTSVYEGKIGQKVASNLITVIDDATIPGNYGSYRFDDEGTPAQKKILIENGILKIYMSDLYYSNILKLSSSGNGRRENYHTKPQPRMTNTYIERGNTDPQEIINSVKNGLLVKKLGGGQVNVTNGDFVFDVQESYLIENGKIKEPVRGAMLIGNGPKILNDIDMVGNDLNFITGTCGKGDHAPVTDAMPTIRIPEIVVGGRA